MSDDSHDYKRRSGAQDNPPVWQNHYIRYRLFNRYNLTFLAMDHKSTGFTCGVGILCKVFPAFSLPSNGRPLFGNRIRSGR